ncbi:MAG: hypothetical protein M3R24_14060 [Chloroflexota bacterium]|nr:hypothetical protein [Chloroflexota bacterium]
MTRTTSRPAPRTRGRTVQRRSSGWRIPALIVGIVLIVSIAGMFTAFGSATAGNTQAIATLPSEDVHAVVWNGGDSGPIFAGHHGGVLRSADGGRTWEATSLANADAMGLAVSTQAPTRIYAAGHGIFRRSDDGGATWTAPETTIQGADIHGFAQSPADPDRLYAFVVGQGLLVSSDGGESWTPQAQLEVGHPVLTVSGDGKTLLLGMANRLQHSTDDGRTWVSSGKALPGGAQVTALATAGDTVFAATTKGLYRRSGPDAEWEPTPLTETILAVAVNPSSPTTLLAVNDRQQVFRSDDGGNTW